MRNLLFVLVLVMFPVHIQAFDFHGIKTGMSKDQVSEALTALGAAPPNERVSLVQLSDGQSLKGVKWSPKSISFEYDHEGRLYSVTLTYPVSLRGPNDPPVAGMHGLAFRSALEKKYGATIELKDVFRGISELEAKVVDEKRRERFLSHLIKEAMAAI